MTAHPLPSTTRAWQLSARPHGVPKPADFTLRDVPLPGLSAGQLLVRNQFLSVDPYMRGKMDANRTDQPYALGELLTGAAVGVVEASQSPDVPMGSLVRHMLGWREHAVVRASDVTVLKGTGIPLSAHLGVLGNGGLTAYAGLSRIANLRKGDVVFVSGAAGAVGSLVGQMARIMGAARVIGSAGTDDKVGQLREEYGFDAAFNYRAAPVTQQLRDAAPEGIDVYFDNVGGDHLEAALDSLNHHGRAVLCGMISQYNATQPIPGPANIMLAVYKSLRLEGMQVSEHTDLRDEFVGRAAEWLREGSLRYHETVAEGLESMANAFIDMLNGVNSGKTVVALAD
ncbi:NADP-dependent oxidoreductase [Streptomyces sp. TG1A-8]|uniref:NADP-dependent oxidoreductase n=1 Tax=Streptomyces sp. TG1A-8 TaxID=3051385 RepID=UPI00265BDC1E|nr:NADP-dependent oxidoreductase [Streptomyces sp. TG1A-8]MDO0924113.1 NADP-dependent oxidoreductase [Streptomyces sp. TG1A-8]